MNLKNQQDNTIYLEHKCSFRVECGGRISHIISHITFPTPVKPFISHEKKLNTATSPYSPTSGADLGISKLKDAVTVQ